MTQSTQFTIETHYTGPFPVTLVDGTICRVPADYSRWVATKRAHDSGTRRVQTHDTAQNGYTLGDAMREQAARDADPADAGKQTAEMYEASARELEAAGQPEAAIQSWHRAAIAHSKAGLHSGVLQAIVHCERLANHKAFAPELERKATGADAEGSVEVVDLDARPDVLLGEQVLREPAQPAEVTDAKGVEVVDLASRSDISIGEEK